MEKFKKMVNKLEKVKKSGEKGDFSYEKEYLKKIIFKEKKDKSTITPNEISIKFGIPQEDVEDILKEESEKNKLENIPKPKKKKINIKIKFNFFNKLLDKSDKKALKDFFLKIIIMGIPLNFALFVIFHIKFGLYSFIGWGIAFWFVKKELVPIVRGIVHK